MVVPARAAKASRSGLEQARKNWRKSSMPPVYRSVKKSQGRVVDLRHSVPYTGTMLDEKTVVEIRRENLRAIASDIGGQARLAEVLGTSEGLISRWIGKNASKPIGEKIARKIEERLGKPRFWLDRVHGINEKLLEAVMEAVDSEFGSKPLPPDQRRRLISLLYALYSEDGVNIDRIRDVVALVQDARKA